MMQAAPAAPRAPAIVAVMSPVELKFDRPPWAPRLEVGDADAEQRLQRITELYLPQVQEDAIGAPREHGTRDEEHPSHTSWPRV
jgi:hypothetical protein